MKALSRRLVQHAHALAKEIHAKAVVIYADALDGDDELRQVLRTVNFPTILFSRGRETPPPTTGPHEPTWIAVPGAHATRTGQARLALLVCLARGVLHRGDRVVCLTGPDGSNRIDTAIVLDLGTEPELFSPVSELDFNGDFSAEVFERVLWIATRIGAEGREGRPVGTLFVVGDADRVREQSRQLILNPLHGHPESERLVLSAALEETLKELALVDGAFIVRGDGVVLAAGVQLEPSVRGPLLPSGLGTRHAAAAGITASTSAVAFVVSQSTGTVTVFKGGRVLTEIHRAAGQRPMRTSHTESTSTSIGPAPSPLEPQPAFPSPQPVVGAAAADD